MINGIESECWLKGLSIYVIVFRKHKPFAYFECMKLGLRDI